MSDHPNDGFYDTRRDRESAALGEDPRKPLAAPKAVRSSPPRTKAVIAVKVYFEAKLGSFSDARHVPLWESVGKMHANIDYLIKQGHSQDTLERAIDFFVSQAPSMLFQGSSLWDQFFAHREDALKFAAVSGIGTRGGPREASDDLAKRLSQHQQQTRSK